ncbi:MAG: ASPIC/UnbV domain-containing protein [Candidatus Marinimicrobia bacterium]|nr:ASPIC/UnbV domain-containing protein [Candidatus Neomarinimicrobiota bacterium]
MSGANTMMKIVEGGGGFSSQNSIPVEFGLGSATSVDSIIVNWPYGRDQVIMTSEIDTTILITEDIYEHDMIASGYIDTKKMILLK